MLTSLIGHRRGKGVQKSYLPKPSTAIQKCQHALFVLVEVIQQVPRGALIYPPSLFGLLDIWCWRRISLPTECDEVIITGFEMSDLR
jgi:hypothetical protein